MRIAKALLLVLFLAGPALAQELPPDMLADMYLLEAVKALESGDQQQALQAFQKIEALAVEPPPLFAYLYGKLLVERGAGVEAWRRGQALLRQFAIAAGRDSEHYTPTLELLLAVEASLAAAERQTRFEDRLRHWLSGSKHGSDGRGRLWDLRFRRVTEIGKPEGRVDECATASSGIWRLSLAQSTQLTGLVYLPLGGAYRRLRGCMAR